MDKHVGEMNSDQLHETTMNKENRRLKQFTIADMEKAAVTFNQLMGESVAPRKAFIAQNAYRANEG